VDPLNGSSASPSDYAGAALGDDEGLDDVLLRKAAAGAWVQIRRCADTAPQRDTLASWNWGARPSAHRTACADES
jgi:hypothetical protein